MRIVQIPAQGFASNCWLALDPGTMDAVIIDPSAGMEEIRSVLRRESARLIAVLLTHGHFDHLYSLDAIRDETGVPAMLAEGDAACPSDLIANVSEIMLHENHLYRAADRLLHDGDENRRRSASLSVLAAPAHSPARSVFRGGGSDFCSPRYAVRRRNRADDFSRGDA